MTTLGTVISTRLRVGVRRCCVTGVIVVGIGSPVVLAVGLGQLTAAFTGSSLLVWGLVGVIALTNLVAARLVSSLWRLAVLAPDWGWSSRIVESSSFGPCLEPGLAAGGVAALQSDLPGALPLDRVESGPPFVSARETARSDCWSGDRPKPLGPLPRDSTVASRDDRAQVGRRSGEESKPTESDVVIAPSESVRSRHPAESGDLRSGRAVSPVGAIEASEHVVGDSRFDGWLRAVSHRESWWSIAESELGEGTRWPELVECSADLPDGRGGTITSSTRLRRGMRIRVPSE